MAENRLLPKDEASRDSTAHPSASGASPRLYQRLVAILSEQITSGVLQPGASLFESHVAETFGTSRAPARQALAELVRVGLVGRSSVQGYVVSQRDGRVPMPVAPQAGSPAIMLTASSTWERIYGEVEAEIASRTTFATWRINETELARYHQVSRTVARDVLARLQQRGLIKKDGQSRWYAPALTPDYVGELYQMRWLLEPVALVDAYPQMPGERLRQAEANLRSAIGRATDLEGRDLDLLEKEMHIDLLGYCGNRTLMEAIGLYQSLLIAHTFLYAWMPRMFDTEPFLPEHHAVLERLTAGKLRDAAQALETHLRVSRDRAVARIARAVREIEPAPIAYLSVLKAS